MNRQLAIGLAMGFSGLLILGCDARHISWIRVSINIDGAAIDGTTQKLWPAVRQRAQALGMTCYEDLTTGSQPHSSLKQEIRSELFCVWHKKKRKMMLSAVYSDHDVLVQVAWDTTEFWYGQTEGSTIVKNLEAHFRDGAPNAKIEFCLDQCRSPN